MTRHTSTSNLTPQETHTILGLRLLIARAANKDSLKWWDDESFTTHAGFLLDRIFPMAPPLAARSLSLAAAIARHRAACTEETLYLYRLDSDNRDGLALRFEPLLPIPVPQEPITTLEMLRQHLLALTGNPAPYTVVRKTSTHGLQIEIPSCPPGVELARQLRRGELERLEVRSQRPAYLEKAPRKRLLALEAESGRLLWKKADADTAELMPTTLSAANGRAFFQSPQHVICLDTKTGEELWRAARPVALLRPSWSAPTLVVVDDVVLSADRAGTTAVPEGAFADRKVQWLVSSAGGQAPVGKGPHHDIRTDPRQGHRENMRCKRRLTVSFRSGDFLQNAVPEMIPEGRHSLHVCNLLQLERPDETSHGGQIQSPGSQPFLLPPPAHQGGQSDLPAINQGTTALRPTDFVGTEGKHVQAHLGKPLAHMTESLHGIGMNRHIRDMPADGTGDFGHIEDRPDFVVRVHDGQDTGLWCHRISHFVRVHPPSPATGHHHHAPAQALDHRPAPQYRGMLQCRGADVPAPLGRNPP